MRKKVLIIAASPRKNGNSNRLAAEFEKGASAAGHEVEAVYLYDRQIGFCRGCFACLKTGRCVQRDDADALAQKMLTAQVLVFATPVYCYNICGQLKTVLDRTNPLYAADYAFREVYLLAAATENAADTVNGAADSLRGWIACFKKTRLAGVVFAGGVGGVGEIEGHPALTEAFEAGKSV